MTENQNIPWKSIVVEAAAVVGSILLAFAIDAYWEERAERQDELEVLGALLVNLICTEKIRKACLADTWVISIVAEEIHTTYGDIECFVGFGFHHTFFGLQTRIGLPGHIGLQFFIYLVVKNGIAK